MRSRAITSSASGERPFPCSRLVEVDGRAVLETLDQHHLSPGPALTRLKPSRCVSLAAPADRSRRHVVSRGLHQQPLGRRLERRLGHGRPTIARAQRCSPPRKWTLRAAAPWEFALICIDARSGRRACTTTVRPRAAVLPAQPPRSRVSFHLDECPPTSGVRPRSRLYRRLRFGDTFSDRRPIGRSADAPRQYACGSPSPRDASAAPAKGDLGRERGPAARRSLAVAAATPATSRVGRAFRLNSSP